MQLTSFSAYPSAYVAQKQPIPGKATPLRFGDALFERHKKFENEDKVELSKPIPLWEAGFSPSAMADTLLERSKPLYESTGRFIRGANALPSALDDVALEYGFRQANAVQNPKDTAAGQARDLVGVKLANAQLAADISEDKNAEALRLLTQALNGLKASDYAKGPVSPVYIHGLYNRGTYAFNNELYKLNEKADGPAEMRMGDKHFEGLTVSTCANPSALVKKMKAGLPYLNQAIELASKMPDQQLAKAEYQIAKGEMQHAMAHLSANDPYAYMSLSQYSRDSFQDAWETLDAMRPASPSPRYKELMRNLVKIKMPHLCTPAHRRTRDVAFNQCGAFEQRNNDAGIVQTSKPFSVFSFIFGS